jgi:hypothetical protein
VPILAELSIADDPDDWRAAGFTVDDGGQCVVGRVRLWLRPQEGRTGIVAWAFDAIDAIDEVRAIDGLPTTATALDPPDPWAHPNGSVQLDHVVLATPDLARTQAAMEAVGFDVRRVRDVGPKLRQVFFRAGEVIVEMVGPPEPEAGDRPVALWGLVANVDDLDATKALLGDHLTDPKDAVQPGRRIATLKTRDLGISTAVAFMSV